MSKIDISDKHIKLGQALKLSGLVSSGFEAKTAIQAGKVTVNGVVERQRGKKIYNGDVVSYNGETVTVLQC